MNHKASRPCPGLIRRPSKESEKEPSVEIFSSITASLWWATVSLATVGYGDVVPITTWGKIFAGFISLIGIGIVAIPTGIISASFVEEIHHFRKKR